MADASSAVRPATPQAPARKRAEAFNGHSVWAMYRFQMVRFFRTAGESLATPVITTALYFVVFGSAIGGRMQPVVEGLEYGSFLVPGLIMLSIFTNSIFNASFGIYFPKFTGTIYELLSAPISYLEIVIAFVGAAATKSVILGLVILATAYLFVPVQILHPVEMLVFLFLVVGGSLGLYAVRAPAVSSRVSFAWVSRESLLLCNNVVFLVAALTVLFGTLFPLIVDALGMGKVSVGPPYFNAVFVPLMALLVPVMGLGPVSRWKRDAVSRWRGELLIPAIVAVLCAITLPLLHAPYNLWVALAVLLSSWLLLGLAKDFWQRLRSASGTANGLRRLTPAYCGMVVAHLGFAACVIGIVATSQYSVEHDLKMNPGDTRELAGYEFRFVEVAQVRGPNFVADEARFEVTRNGEWVADMNPQKRRYLASGSVMTEAAINAGLFRDLYVAMGEPVGSDGAWAMRLHYKPLVRWMWLGAILMAVGAFTAAADKRYRRQREVARADSKVALHGA